MPEIKSKKVILCFKCVNCGHFIEVPDEIPTEYLNGTKRICTCIVTEKPDYTVFGMMNLEFVKVEK